jgi:D-glycero-D-manno-heptose 1,7-bisphosphate phosphatase
MKAVFLDRDGVINELVYHQERGIIDTPFTVGQFRLVPGVAEAIRYLREILYKVVIVSNQPGMAKGHMSWETFEDIRLKMKEELTVRQAYVDREYYCFHHPNAVIDTLRVKCQCRKPRPGMLLQAASDMRLDISQSWLVGDNLTDIKAGRNAGCRTIFLGRAKCEFCKLMEDNYTKPDMICADLLEAAHRILEMEFSGKRVVESVTKEA